MSKNISSASEQKQEEKCGAGCLRLWLSTKEASDYLGLCDGTLRNARNRGVLAGVKPPAYRKLGRVCRYHREDLDAWLDQFQTQTSTSEEATKAVDA